MDSSMIVDIIRRDERQRLINEGWIRKEDCPKFKEEKRNRELKKANNSLQRKITELTLELNTIKMMR